MDEFLAQQEHEEVDADIVNLDGGAIENVEAETVRISQGGAQRIIAAQVGLERGGAGVINSENVHLQLSGAITVRGDNVTIHDGGAGVVVADRISGTNASIGVAVTNSAELDGSTAVLLLAREVHGNVETVLDARGTIIAGLVAGVAIGMVIFVGSLLVRRGRQ